MNEAARVYVCGHNGMVGSAILNRLADAGYSNVVTASSKDLDLRRQDEVEHFFAKEKPEYVFLAAARVGGIGANIKSPAAFTYDNLMIQNNVIHSSYLSGVKKLLFLGSSCIYPRSCPQPMKEEYLLTGELEPTNEGYALAKIAGLRMLEYYRRQYGFNGISIMPCNLYGPNDSFDLEHSHVLSAMVRRFVDARNSSADRVTLWGTGVARREFMHVNDAANAALFFMENYEEEAFVNVGWGEDVSIRELAELVAKTAGYEGEKAWDDTKPDGMLKKCMDVSRMRTLGFEPKVALEKGVREMIEMYEASIKGESK